MNIFVYFNTNLFVYLFLFNVILFFIGLFGFLFLSSHYIYLIICNEIMLFSFVLQFLLVGIIYDDLTAQIFVLFLLLLSSAEVVLALSVIIRYYKLTSIVYITPVYYVLHSS